MTKTFKNTEELNQYILDRVNHETDIIMESEWFEDLLERKLKEILKKKVVLVSSTEDSTND